jgi:hypothetical protein
MTGDRGAEVNFFYSEDSEEGSAFAKVHASPADLLRFDSGGDIDWFLDDRK